MKQPKLVVSSYSSYLLEETEIEDILETLRAAKAAGKVGSMTHDYRPGAKELLYLIPKDEHILTARDRIQTVLEHEYGLKYLVNLK